jgi:uncharacterized membrane protein
MQSYYWRLIGKKAQEEHPVGWGLIAAIVITILAIIFIVWLSRQSGRSILDMLRGIL